MAVAKKFQKFDQYSLRGKLRQEGFERWRYTFCASNKISGEERNFFIEMYLVNPVISPKVVVIAQKSRLALNENEIQYALAGTDSAIKGDTEIVVRPSYVVIKAGVYGMPAKQLNKFIPSSELFFSKNECSFKVGECTFAPNALFGAISVSAQELRVKPEIASDAGIMDWDLKFERQISCGMIHSGKDQSFVPYGIKTSFAGTIHLDGEEYIVNPRSSFGYSDKSWGQSLLKNYYHLSASKMTSIISGKSMANSCFVIEGEYDGALKAFINVDGHSFKIEKKSFFNRFTEIHDVNQMPANEDGDKIHWSMSIHKGKYVIDLDIMCRADEMLVRDYEIPQGKRTLLRVLGGGTGKGEIRIFKKNGKNLELLEHANIFDAMCEYGHFEEIGNTAISSDFED